MHFGHIIYVGNPKGKVTQVMENMENTNAYRSPGG